MPDITPITPPTPPKKRRSQVGPLVGLFIFLTYAVQAGWLLWIIPSFRVMVGELHLSPNHPLPASTRFFFAASKLAVHAPSLTVILCAALALGHGWMYFKGGQSQRLLAGALLVVWILFLLTEVIAMFLPIIVDIKALPLK